jgi:membrane-associated phospholipid phosphatase
MSPDSPLFPLAMAITDFGESSVLLPTAILASGWFWISHHRRLALVWLFTVGGCALSMMGFKLIFLTCGQYLLGEAVQTPSGHTALSTLFYGAAALTIERISPATARHRTAIFLGALGFALAIGVSRILVNAHTEGEVIIGLMVGSAWLAVFALLLRHGEREIEMPPLAVMLTLAVIYGGLLAVSMAGRHMNVEGVLRHVAWVIHHRLDVCTG